MEPDQELSIQSGKPMVVPGLVWNLFGWQYPGLEVSLVHAGVAEYFSSHFVIQAVVILTVN